MGVKEELQEAAENGSLVIGTEETLKDMESLDKVIMASNVPRDVEEEVGDAAEDAGVEVEKAGVDNRQIGSLCMKPFSTSVVGIQ